MRPERNCAPAGDTVEARGITRTSDDTSVNHLRPLAQRLPAFGRQLKAALDTGLRPRTGGGCVIVTSDWDFARAFYPGRVVCPRIDPPETFEFAFLRGIEVVVVVPERDEVHGEQLVARIRNAGARLVVLVVDRGCEP